MSEPTEPRNTRARPIRYFDSQQFWKSPEVGLCLAEFADIVLCKDGKPTVVLCSFDSVGGEMRFAALGPDAAMANTDPRSPEGTASEDPLPL